MPTPIAPFIAALVGGLSSGFLGEGRDRYCLLSNGSTSLLRESLISEVKALLKGGDMIRALKLQRL